MATITFSELAAPHGRARQAGPARPGLIARVLDRLSAARQCKADRDIAEILRRRGGIMARAEAGLARPSGGRGPAHPFHVLPALRPR